MEQPTSISPEQRAELLDRRLEGARAQATKLERGVAGPQGKLWEELVLELLRRSRISQGLEDPTVNAELVSALMKLIGKLGNCAEFGRRDEPLSPERVRQIIAGLKVAAEVMDGSNISKL